MDPRMIHHQNTTNAHQRPSYPQSQDSSQASSVFNSSSSLSSLSSSTTTASYMPVEQAQNNHLNSFMPLAPTTSRSQEYYNSLPPQQQEQQQSNQLSRPTQQERHNSYQGQRGNNAGAPETAPFLDSFNLLAEAAKRAQVACLMRDLGDFEL